MKYPIIFFYFLFLSGLLFSQNKKIDSLLAEYEKLIQAGETKKANRVLLTAEVEAKTTTPVNAIRYFQRALTIAESYQNSQLIADCHGIIGRLYSEQGLYFQSLDYMVKAYKIYKNIGYEDSLGYLYIDIGNAYYAQGLTDIPIRYYRKAYQIHINRKDYWGMATSLNNIALVHQRQMQWDSAAYYYQQALEARRKTPYAYLIAHSYYYIGRLHYLKKEYAEALHYLAQGETIALREIDRLRQQKDSINIHEYTFGWITTVETIYSLYHSMAEIYRESQKNDSAIMFYHSAMKYYYESPKLLVNIGIKLHLKIAEMYLLTGKLSRAEHFARQAIALSDSINRVDLKNESLLLLSDVHVRQGKKRKRWIISGNILPLSMMWILTNNLIKSPIIRPFWGITKTGYL